MVGSLARNVGFFCCWGREVNRMFYFFFETKLLVV